MALRWRTEEEVIKGIGQFSCASIRCESHSILDDDEPPEIFLKTWEINFAYMEERDESSIGESVKKEALVKVSF